MSILCKLGLHKIRSCRHKRLPALPPKYPAPAYVEVACVRSGCGKRDWFFYENYLPNSRFATPTKESGE